MKAFRKHTTSHSKVNKLTTFGASLFLSVCTVQSALAQVNLSQVPLFLKESVDSNLVFVFDDSGSMGWRYMPDDLGGNDVYNNHYYSSHVNKIYYDPTVTYTPPYKPDGSGRYPDSSYTAAWVNGFDQSDDSTKDDLRTYIRFDGLGDIEQGFYMQFNSSDSCDADPKQNSCYKTVLLNDASDDVKQNYANWFSYYSRRDLAAKSGITEAFFDLPESIRLGYGAINVNNNTIDGVDGTNTLVSGVRTYDANRREQFLTWLHGKSVGGGTPLRTALKDVGEYYSRTDNLGPWGEEPGTNNTTAHTECRQSFGLIMTDGIWNGSDPAVGNADNTAGPSYTNPDPDGKDFEYKNVSPFADAYSNTLADVAMAYWKNDLRDDLDNKVPVTSTDPAFWQHMTSFTIGLGVNGNIAESDAVKAVETGDTINWPEPGSDKSPENIDDLLHAAINGRGGYASAQNPTEFTAEIQGFLDDVIARSETSASSAAVSSSVLQTGTLGYFAGFRSEDWSGTLTAIDLSTGDVEWDAETKLANTLPENRTLITYNGTNAVELAFDSATSLSNLSTEQQNALNADPTQAGTLDNLGYKRLAWLHGDNPADDSFRDRSAETPGGATVTRLLGDIVNGNPQIVGNSNYGYASLDDEGSSYGAFRSTSAYQNRTKTLYVASNDGILHAFDGETGTEMFGYIPSELLLPAGSNSHARISELMRPDYSHRFYLDGTPQIQDAYVDKNGNGSAEWRTILVGTMGAGGKTVFALDVTDPGEFSPSEDVMWEFQHANLGYGVTDARIARLEDGRWVALFGNGYNGANDQASLFVVDLSDGSLIRELQTGVGSSTASNGLAAPTIGSFPERDAVSRYAYAGDLLGNLWRFDITGTRSSSWSTTKVFTAASPAGNTQPITVAPRVAINPNDDEELVVTFGTGSFIRSGDENDNDIQTFYAIKDNLTEFNLSRSDLLQQTITTQETVTVERDDGSDQTYTLRDTSSNELTDEKGWYLDLAYNGIKSGERVISRAAFPFGVYSNRVRFNTVIPDTDPCGSSRTGFLMDLKLTTGEKSDQPVFDLDGDGQFNTNDIVNGYPASGIEWGEGEEIRTIKIISDPPGETEALIGNPGGTPSCEAGLCTRTLKNALGRQTWEQLR
ncbi:PilC/PilY family type IV pilus protein [Marinobacter sp. CHS3-4]|uniref:pilus assembly protein n=1 Tax=Marinobacter sp. CHS3-4 TaxID=3045174 RepID=UPI0024B48B00|nr:PilC/PilY family type IV pilus protein [Marinobacter sp. CHS3-4]MDI9246783.1 PilC/PilY family type IV pilus protein [Marinobacter sp. CHS3-4]